VCRPCAVTPIPCGISRFPFNMSNKCSRAGIVGGKLLVHEVPYASSESQVGLSAVIRPSWRAAVPARSETRRVPARKAWATLMAKNTLAGTHSSRASTGPSCRSRQPDHALMQNQLNKLSADKRLFESQNLPRSSMRLFAVGVRESRMADRT